MPAKASKKGGRVMMAPGSLRPEWGSLRGYVQRLKFLFQSSSFTGALVFSPRKASFCTVKGVNDARERNMMEELLQKYIVLWNLVPHGISQETPSSFLYFVTCGNRETVLKLFKTHSNEKNSAKVLGHYNGNGAVRLLQASDEAVLLERITPGNLLSELVVNHQDDAATRIFCGVVQRLHAAKFEPHDIRSLSVLTAVYEKHLVGSNTILPLAIVQHAKNTFEELCSTQQRLVLLHGDLHHHNILYDDQRSWLCIDPVGYIGEPEFEAAAFLKNPVHPRYYADERVIIRRIRIISETLQVDAQRILLWTYSYYVITLLWNIEDGVFKEEELPMLSVLQKMIASTL